MYANQLYLLIFLGGGGGNVISFFFNGGFFYELIKTCYKFVFWQYSLGIF